MLAFSLVGCGEEEVVSDSPMVAQFKDKILTEEQLDFYIPDNVSSEDSARFAKQFTDRWVREQAVMDHALTEDAALETKVNFKVENYRAKLIMHEYHAKVLSNLEREVPLDDIRTYYEENKDNFRSDQEYFSYFYLVTTETDGIDQAGQWMRSSNQADIAQLQEWCATNTREFKVDSTYRSSERVEVISKGYFGNLKKAARGQLIRWNGVIRGVRRRYMFKMLDVVKPGDYLPLSLCEERIQAILRNERRVKLIEESEQKILKDAEANNYIIR